MGPGGGWGGAGAVPGGSRIRTRKGLSEKTGPLELSSAKTTKSPAWSRREIATALLKAVRGITRLNVVIERDTPTGGPVQCANYRQGRFHGQGVLPARPG